MVRRKTTATAERVLGCIGLFTIGVVAAAAERIDKDRRSERSSAAGRAAIAVVASAGRIVDRISGARHGHDGLLAQREASAK